MAVIWTMTSPSLAQTKCGVSFGSEKNVPVGYGLSLPSSHVSPRPKYIVPDRTTTVRHSSGCVCGGPFKPFGNFVRNSDGERDRQGHLIALHGLSPSALSTRMGVQRNKFPSRQLAQLESEELAQTCRVFMRQAGFRGEPTLADGQGRREE